MMMKYGTSLNFLSPNHPCSTYIIIIAIIIFRSLLKLYATLDFNIFSFEPVQDERNFSSLKLNYVTITLTFGKKARNNLNVSFFRL